MNIEYISEDEIWAKADEFRARFAADSLPPVDVIFIAEVDMGLSVVPVPQLFSKIGMDAALAAGEETIYVDEESYMKWESGQHWVEKRMRFSFAHELGHLMLHRYIIKRCAFHSLDDYRGWAKEPEHYRRAEYQADEFAGRLLVPLELLREEYDRHQAEARKYDTHWQEIAGMREHIAKKIAPRFGVNHQVIEIRFDREGIWPVT